MGVGLGVGLGDGNGVGEGDGNGVGLGDGKGVGEGDGNGVGLGDGKGVGDAVGEGVGVGPGPQDPAGHPHCSVTVVLEANSGLRMQGAPTALPLQPPLQPASTSFPVNDAGGPRIAVI